MAQPDHSPDAMRRFLDGRPGGHATLGAMVVVILGMLLALALALVVVALVAIPAAREGDTLLTAEGQERVADTMTAARDKVTSR